MISISGIRMKRCDVVSIPATRGDYRYLSTRLLFRVGETEQCRNITILNDDTQENTEDFFFSLQRVPGTDSRINIFEERGEVIITDCDRER